ncbi:MAG: 5-formyltetrahydrofolate cyclo-ligase [Myxococcota bacterium]
MKRTPWQQLYVNEVYVLPIRVVMRVPWICRSLRCQITSELSPGYRSIPEPQGRPCALPEIEAIVVPGLAFDKKGGRIGYGAGYYDRTLSVYPGVTIGLAYDFQVVSTLPQASHDAPMDWIITPAGALEIAEASAGGVVP